MLSQFNASNSDLLNALRDKKRVKIVITGAWCPFKDGSVAVPDYHKLVYNLDEIVMFVVPSAPNSIFMGRIEHIGCLVAHHGRSYNVSCIPRPKCRDSANTINFLKHSNVTRSQILCRLIKGPKLYKRQGKK